MMLSLIAAVALGGTGHCGTAYVQQAQVYNGYAQTYVAKQAYAPAYYAPVYEYKYRASYAGLPVGSEESARQLLIIEQQSRALEKVIDSQNERIRNLESERVGISNQQAAPPAVEAAPPPMPQSEPPQPSTAPPQSQPLPQRQVMPPARPEPPPPQQTAKARMPHSKALSVFDRKCSQCHVGEQGRQNEWVMDRMQLARPTPELRLYVSNAIKRKTNPMPKGGALTAEEHRVLDEWASFTKSELKAGLARRSTSDFE